MQAQSNEIADIDVNQPECSHRSEKGRRRELRRIRNRENKETVYYTNLLQMIHQPSFETDIDKELFARNVFNEMSGDLTTLSRDTVASRVIKCILPYAEIHVVRRFIKEFAQDFRSICCHPYSSHVFRQVFGECIKRIKEKHGSNEMGDFISWARQVGRELLNFLAEFVWDPYGNIVIRTVIERYASLPLGIQCTSDDEWYSESCASQVDLPTYVNPNYYGLTKGFAKWIIRLHKFSDVPFNGMGSGLLQTIILVTNQVDKKRTKKLLSRLINKCFKLRTVPKEKQRDEVGDDDDDDNDDKEDEELVGIPLALKDSSAAKVVEAALTVAPHKAYARMYRKCFKRNLVELCKSEIGYHCVQKLIAVCSDKQYLEYIFDEMIGDLADIIFLRPTVIVCLGFACVRLKTRQTEYMTEVMKFFRCFDPPERQLRLMPVLLRFSNNSGYTIYGSLILQILLKFQKPSKAVRSILAQDSRELLTFFCHYTGCYVVKAFMTAPAIDESCCNKLIEKLRTSYVLLACNKYGSRTLDSMWKASNLKYRSMITRELAPCKRQLNNNEFGVHFVRMCRLSLYRHRKHEWKVKIYRECQKRSAIVDLTD